MGSLSPPNFLAATAVALFLGAGASGFQVLNLAVALKAAENAYMGRVAAVTMMASSLSGFAAFPIGILADQYGLREVLFGMGCAVFVVSLILAAWRSRAAPGVVAEPALTAGG